MNRVSYYETQKWNLCLPEIANPRFLHVKDDQKSDYCDEGMSGINTAASQWKLIAHQEQSRTPSGSWSCLRSMPSLELPQSRTSTADYSKAELLHSQIPYPASE